MGLDVLLERLYGCVLVPEAVAAELQRPQTPQTVQAWMANPPPWIKVIPSRLATLTQSISTALDPGEQAVLALALEIRADLILMDERAGAAEAKRVGLLVIGTLGILVQSAELGWIDLETALNDLQKTNFRVNPRLVQQILTAHKRGRFHPSK